MFRNKKAMEWMYVVSAIIAVLILVVTIFFIGRGTSEAKSNLDVFQSCEGQKGKCEHICPGDKTAQYKALGCGSGNYKDKEYCCLPPLT